MNLKNLIFIIIFIPTIWILINTCGLITDTNEEISTFSDQSWTEIQGIYGLDVNSFALDINDQIVAPRTYDLYLSKNVGETWSKMRFVFRNPEIASLTIPTPTGRTLFEANIELSRLEENGTEITWLQRPDGFFGGIEKYGWSPSGDLYVLTLFSKFFKSSDEGFSWELIDLPELFDDFVIDYSGIMVARLDDRFFISESEGNTWKEQPLLENNYSNNVDQIFIDHRGRILSTIIDEGIFELSENMDQWTQLTSEYKPNISVSPTGTFFSFDSGGEIYVSTNQGFIWSKRDYPHGVKFPFKFDSEGRVYIFNNINELQLSEDDGLSWTTVGPPALGLYEISEGEMGQLFGQSVHYRVWVSENDGLSWSLMEKSRSDRIELLDADEFYMYALMHNKLVRTPDKGLTWESISEDNFFYIPTASPIRPFLISEHGKIFMADTEGIYRYTGSSTSWELVASRNTINEPFESIVDVHQSKNGIIYAILSGFGLLKSEDEGDNWVEIPFSEDSGLKKSNPSDFDVDESGNLYIIDYVTGIYKSEDGGVIWNAIILDTKTEADPTRMMIDNSNRIFVTTDNGLYLSHNEGKSWDSIDWSLLTERQTRLGQLPSARVYQSKSGRIFATIWLYGSLWTDE